MVAFTGTDFADLFPDYSVHRHSMSQVIHDTIKIFIQVALGGEMDIDNNFPPGALSTIDFDGQAVEAVPLKITATLSHCFGQRLTNETRLATCDFSWDDLKLPKPVYERMGADSDFCRHLALIIWLRRERDLLTKMPSDRCLNCASKQAVAFVTSITPKFGGPDGDEEKLILKVVPALPVCEELACCRRLEKVIDRFHRNHNMSKRDLHKLGVFCQNCSKVGGAEMKKCGGCKAVYYCSRECQVKDWPEHKVSCRKLSKNKLSKQS